MLKTTVAPEYVWIAPFDPQNPDAYPNPEAPANWQNGDVPSGVGCNIRVKMGTANLAMPVKSMNNLVVEAGYGKTIDAYTDFLFATGKFEVTGTAELNSCNIYSNWDVIFNQSLVTNGTVAIKVEKRVAPIVDASGNPINTFPAPVIKTKGSADITGTFRLDGFWENSAAIDIKANSKITTDLENGGGENTGAISTSSNNARLEKDFENKGTISALGNYGQSQVTLTVTSVVSGTGVIEAKAGGQLILAGLKNLPAPAGTMTTCGFESGIIGIDASSQIIVQNGIYKPASILFVEGIAQEATIIGDCYLEGTIIDINSANLQQAPDLSGLIFTNDVLVKNCNIRTTLNFEQNEMNYIRARKWTSVNQSTLNVRPIGNQVVGQWDLIQTPDGVVGNALTPLTGYIEGQTPTSVYLRVE